MVLMSLNQFFSVAFAFLYCINTFAISGTGYSTYPLRKDDKLIGVEATGVTSDGGGFGLQARYTQKTARRVVIDTGIGTSGGERSSRVFVNAEYEIYPDYLRQPRFTLRTGFEHSDEYERRRNKIHLAPLLSKGFNVWGKEMFPFLSLPTGISLEKSSRSYESFTNLNAGLTGKLPFGGYEHLLGTIEGTMNIRNSYSGMFVGLSYPIQ